jgi:hypothetical protein
LMYAIDHNGPNVVRLVCSVRVLVLQYGASKMIRIIIIRIIIIRIIIIRIIIIRIIILRIITIIIIIMIMIRAP